MGATTLTIRGLAERRHSPQAVRIAEETYTEVAPITESFERLLDLLGLGAVDKAENGKQL